MGMGNKGWNGERGYEGEGAKSWGQGLDEEQRQAPSFLRLSAQVLSSENGCICPEWNEM